MIAFENITLHQGKKFVLNNVSFTIGQSERVAILGGSGEGKTTILKLIMRLIQPDEGKIIIDGEDITDLAEKKLTEKRMKLGIVFQDGALFDSMNVRENVAFYLREHTNLSESLIRKKVSELLDVVAMSGTEELMPEELSGGMQRRIAIARSLTASEPKMFLYDEPTSGLDPVSTAKISQLILSLAVHGKGFVIVTHEIPVALKTAQRFIFLNNGSICFDGNKNEFLKSTNQNLNEFLNNWREQRPMG
ncbi:MAG: ATP-binding cassette domain-containing protein [Chitinispirillales bacterium]|jgi:phospholipid/cholesterol/gamma-HCH transport system ATP-binding protein|nr:ATP-binding cassette domain-containing protein [Chitinispirillales bacterium]